MRIELHKYDIYPKVFPLGSHSFTIKPLGKYLEFTEENGYTVHIVGASSRVVYGENPENLAVYHIMPNADGNLVITHNFDAEQVYFVRLHNYNSEHCFVQLTLFAVEDDLAGRDPLMGDLHHHSTVSDGAQSPEIVAAIHRGNGFDFMTVSDHWRYRGSLQAINAYKDVNLDFLLVPGEEVHSPGNFVHIINFGSKYSVFSLIEGHNQDIEDGHTAKYRAMEGVTPPDQISLEEYYAQVEEISATLDMPDGDNKFAYASSVWVWNKIREAEGLGVYCHPFWLENTYNVPAALHSEFTKNAPFDALEVVSDFDHGNITSAHYYEDRAKGYVYPIVGSSDSHNSIHTTINMSGKTIVFAPENERASIISSIKDFYSVAVSVTKSKDKTFIGSFRLVKYAGFLYDNYFPIHDEICREEGRLMQEYACGSEDAKRRLNDIGMQTYELRRKYFAW